MSLLKANTIKPVTSGADLSLQGDSGGSAVDCLNITSAGDVDFAGNADAKIKLPSAGGIYESDGSTPVLTESGGVVALGSAVTGVGTVLQIVQFTSQASYATTTSDTWEALSVLKAVTPKATASTFLVELSGIGSAGGNTWLRTGMKASGDSIVDTAFGVVDATPLSRSDPASSADIERVAWNIIVDLDQSNITDAITFTVWMNTGTLGVQGYLGSRNAVAGTLAWTFLTITEIA